MEYHVVVLQTQYVSAKEAHSHSLYIFLPPASQYITIFLSPRALPLDWSMGTCYSKNTEYLLLFGGIFFGGCLWGGGLFGVYQKIVEGGCATSVKSKEYFALYPLSDQIKKHTHSYPFHVWKRESQKKSKWTYNQESLSKVFHDHAMLQKKLICYAYVNFEFIWCFKFF